MDRLRVLPLYHARLFTHRLAVHHRGVLIILFRKTSGEGPLRICIVMAAAALGVSMALAPSVRAGVSIEEAQQLNANLTPMGAERAGNAQEIGRASCRERV